MDKMYALLNEENNVINVIMLDDESSQETIDLIVETNNAVNIKPIDEYKWWTHYYMGGHYEGNVLWSLKPYASWIKNYEEKDWVPPIPYPNDEKEYYWDEETVSWKLSQYI